MRSLLLSVLYLCLLWFTNPAYAKDNLATIRYLDMLDQVERERQGTEVNDLSNDSNNRVVQLLRLIRDNTTGLVAPQIKEKPPVNTLQLGSWSNYWQVGWGRQYFINAFEVHLFIYGEQTWGELDSYGLIEQEKFSCEQDPINGCFSQTVSDDLKFTLSTFGIGGTVYYLRTKDNSLALGLEAPLFAFHQLRLESKTAKKNYRINGLSLLGLPISRHTIITPLKLRYQPVKWFSTTLSVKFSSMTAFQQNPDKYSETTEGEWINKCKTEDCYFQSTTGNLGMEIIF